MKNCLVIGGSGALGKSIVNTFKDSYRVVSIDFVKNNECHLNILLKQGEEPKQYLPQMYKDLSEFSSRYDSILCVAGGWIGGSVKDIEIFEQCEKMHNMNVKSALLTYHLASKFLNKEGLLLFTGAALPFKEPTPDMLAYALSKTATHAISLNAAQKKEIPSDSTVTTILPETIDTPSNRDAMPNSDFSKWTEPNKIAGLIKMWADGVNRPENGSYAVLKSVNGMVVPEFV